MHGTTFTKLEVYAQICGSPIATSFRILMTISVPLCQIQMFSRVLLSLIDCVPGSSQAERHHNEHNPDPESRVGLFHLFKASHERDEIIRRKYISILRSHLTSVTGCFTVPVTRSTKWS